VDITQLILDDHHEQRRLFAIMEQVDRSDPETLGAVWDRLAAFLELHAAAEEEIFYPALLRVGIQARRARTAEDETLDAIGDHNDIRDAVMSVPGHPVGSDEWYAGVAAANLANSDHMGEEEREGLADFRRLASLQLRHDLAVAWVRYEAQHYAGVQPVDKDPAGYIREEEQRQGLQGAGLLDGSLPDGAAADSGGTEDGSLSIGSLRTS
jgi:hypothetical protein